VLDIGDCLNKTEDGMEQEVFYQEYARAIFDMCSHYEELYRLMEHDMELVSKELMPGHSRTQPGKRQILA
jgi:hypothetical protein